ncbi:uncharacterized protein LOC107041751 [Diachasma alloeum]|uniref:uncharacterized protein LOC107041751 n=1 Tax=Diachasma alloeum TaxID=454923 RepID=UPI0007382826|nr:uncharacterized protein LOC107041751 [Diachasma alloeum]
MVLPEEDLQCILEPTKSESVYQKHIPHSVAFYLHCAFDDTRSQFKMNPHEVDTCLKTNVPMEPLSPQQAWDFANAQVCHICEKPFSPTDKKHRDHCHFTGKYRGPAHPACNVNFKNSHTIPVVFHNLSGYDLHFLIKTLATQFPGSVDLLPLNKEKYMSFTKHVDETEEYVDSWEKLNDPQLPPIEKFYSKLSDENVSAEDYAHAQRVWDVVGIIFLDECSDLYLATDVVLLVDIFQNFRPTCSSVYKLDPLHDYTAPGLAFDAMLNCTGVNLELLTDIEMHLFIEKGIRGRMAQCSNRYTCAHNKYMGEKFDPNQKTSYLMYFDVNNLYGAAMSQYLSYGSFQWVNPSIVDIHTIADDSSKGYMLEVDLEYSKELIETHKYLPLCPEHFVPPNKKISKLMTTLLPKKNYRVLEFNQAPWLKPYIDLNTELRKESSNEFEKNFFKLMNNSVFGKTIKNVRIQKDMQLVTKWEERYGAKVRIAQPNFHSGTIFADDLVIVQLERTKMFFNKPIYVGFSILDLSKIFIYDFHYDYIKREFGDSPKLMYTDTDSLLYEFKVPDIYECMKRDIARFDASDYLSDNVYGMPLVNKKVLGLMKDECNGKVMSEFVGFRAKLYKFKIHGDERAKKRAKGVIGSTLKRIAFDDYKDYLENHEHFIESQYLIKSSKHDVHTVHQKKLALSWEDDKRILC